MTDSTKQDEAAKKAADEAAAKKAADKAAKKAADEAKAPVADWQQPDYDGPLDGEKAAWRNKHLKRLGDGHVTKPAAKAEATK